MENRRQRQKHENKRSTSYDRFANSIPNDFPCECQLCRKICINSSFAQQQIKRQRDRERELEQQRKQQRQQQQQQERRIEQKDTETGALLASSRIQQEGTKNRQENKRQNKQTKYKIREKMESNGKNAMGIPEEKGWRDMLDEDEEYRETIQV